MIPQQTTSTNIYIPSSTISVSIPTQPYYEQIGDYAVAQGPLVIQGPTQEQMERLLWLLGLSDQERGFIQHLSKSPADRSLFGIFCDWLKEQGRTQDAQELEACQPSNPETMS